MLSRLSVRNLAVVEETETEFTPGLNIITGETGAGKSVLMGALNLVLGGRADKTLIRDGASEAIVEAVFEPSPQVLQIVDRILEDAGLPRCEENQLIIRRTVPATGNGRCFVNAAMTTAQLLTLLGNRLVDIHGPYDHQSLLGADFQRDVLDAYGDCGPKAENCRKSWKALRALSDELEALRGSPEAFAEETDRLRYVAEEITRAELTAEDEEDLIQRHAQTANAETITQLGNAVTTLLLDGEQTVFDSFVQARHHLAELAHIHPPAQIWLKEIDSLAVQVQELAHTVSESVSLVETDPARLAVLEDRMALVQRLKRKYGKTVVEILASKERAEARLAELLSRDDRIRRLEEDCRAEEKFLVAAAAELTKARTCAARKLAKAVTTALRDLGFLKAELDIALTPVKPGPHGADAVAYMFAPNPGESSRALSDIASSGEIARVMLALKSVLAEHDAIPVLVFDEIDANVGGETGRAVGLKLKQASGTHQVISITHLPQVAVFGDSHLVVRKMVRNNRTSTQIAPLSGIEREEEIARMLGGKDSTSVTLAHAREMLIRAKR